MKAKMNTTKRETGNLRNAGMVENPSLIERIVHAIIIAVLLLIAFCSFIPLWHVLMASFSDGKVLLAHEGLLWLPVGKASLAGYRNVFKDASILSGYANTLIYVVGATSIGMVVNITGGYVLSRESKLRIPLTLMIMLTVLFGGGLIPTYMVIRKLGMTGTRLSLLIPGCTNGMFVIMMMNAFRGVPESTVESARIDGAGHLRTLFHIMLPQAMSLGTVIILNTVIMQWNSWFNASIYVTNNKNLWPLQLWIKQILAENESFLINANPDYSRYLVQYALIIVATLPILIALPFFQEKLEKGIIGGAVKE